MSLSQQRRLIQREYERVAIATRLGIGGKEAEGWSLATLRSLERLAIRVAAIEHRLGEIREVEANG